MPAPGEVLFTPEDTDAQLELLAYERELCPGCSHNLQETTRADSEGKYRARVIACHSCAEKRAAECDIAEDPHTHGLYVVTERRD